MKEDIYYGNWLMQLWSMRNPMTSSDWRNRRVGGIVPSESKGPRIRGSSGVTPSKALKSRALVQVPGFKGRRTGSSSVQPERRMSQFPKRGRCCLFSPFCSIWVLSRLGYDHSHWPEQIFFSSLLIPVLISSGNPPQPQIMSCQWLRSPTLIT